MIILFWSPYYIGPDVIFTLNSQVYNQTLYHIDHLHKFMNWQPAYCSLHYLHLASSLYFGCEVTRFGHFYAFCTNCYFHVPLAMYDRYPFLKNLYFAFSEDKSLDSMDQYSHFSDIIKFIYLRCLYNKWYSTNGPLYCSKLQIHISELVHLHLHLKTFTNHAPTAVQRWATRC